MNESQHHRGPDETGVHIAPGIALGHKRLSIIDLETGQQPLFNEDRSVVIVFNGEIYNYQELIRELSALGHVFRTRSDTEVIVHAWEQWGEDCVEHLRGMFAFAIWDEGRQSLFLARDRLGVKPLFYAQLPDGHWIFGSELKALLAHGGLSRDIDPCAVEDYFALGYVPEPRTIFSAARKLSPGHTLLLRRGQPAPEPRRFWDVQFTGANLISADDARAELIDRLDESVRLRMISEVPLGAFLSGGVDSSAVVAMMAGQSSDPVNTCSISFDDPSFDETRYRAEGRGPLPHAPLRRPGRDRRLRSDRHARCAVRRALCRQLGDPDLPRLPARAPSTSRWRFPATAATRASAAIGATDCTWVRSACAPRCLWRCAKGFSARSDASTPKPIARLASSVRSPPSRPWPATPSRPISTASRSSVTTCGRSFSRRRSSRRLAGYRANEVFHAHARRAQTEDPLSLIQYLDLQTYLVGDINTKVDRASMAHALEVREPLMDHPLVEWLASLPSSLKLRDGEGKWLLKTSLETRLPQDVLYRPKMGFAVPLVRWFRGPLRERVRTALLEGELGRTGFFNRAYLEHLVDAHVAGRRDHSSPLWALLMFEAFLRVGDHGDVAASAAHAPPLAMQAAALA